MSSRGFLYLDPHRFFRVQNGAIPLLAKSSRNTGRRNQRFAILVDMRGKIGPSRWERDLRNLVSETPDPKKLRQKNGWRMAIFQIGQY